VVNRPEAQSYLVQLLEQAPVGIIRLDDKGAIAAANPSACELLERPERELLGRRLGAFSKIRERSIDRLRRSRRRRNGWMSRSFAEPQRRLVI
jgi:PAS domain S-box-containing protein